jgi:hypothetical protein
VLAPRAAFADAVLFTGSGPGAGITLSASALFSISGSTLTITLRNEGDTSGTGQDVPGATLTGVFFDLLGGVTLTPISATIAPGALVQASKCNIGPCSGTTTNVGGEFVYRADAFPDGADRGISSSGYIDAVIGMGNMGGPDLDTPGSPDGINFGIIAPISATNPIFKPNGGLKKEPLIQTEVVLALAISGGTLDVDDISNVSFQYGTSLTEPNIPGRRKPGDPVPEPATLLLLSPAAALLVRRFRRAPEGAFHQTSV